MDSITDYELLLLTYTQNSKPVKPSTDLNDTTYTAFAKMANSISHGDILVQSQQPSVDVQTGLSTLPYTPQQLESFVQNREIFVAEINDLKQKFLLKNDKNALKTRRILQDFLTEQAVKSADLRSNFLIEREKKSLKNAEKRFLFKENEFLSKMRWSAFQQIRFLPEEERKAEGKVLARRQVVMQKTVELQKSYMEQYNNDSIRFLNGLKKFRAEQCKVNCGTDDVIASEAFISQVEGEKGFQHVFNVKVQSIKDMFSGFDQ